MRDVRVHAGNRSPIVESISECGQAIVPGKKQQQLPRNVLLKNGVRDTRDSGRDPIVYAFCINIISRREEALDGQLRALG